LLALTLMHLLSPDLRAVVLPEEPTVPPMAEITFAGTAK
jgi:hypothetical protein